MIPSRAKPFHSPPCRGRFHVWSLCIILIRCISERCVYIYDPLMCVCMYVCVSVCMRMCMCVCMWVSACVYLCLLSDVRVCFCSFVPVCMSMGIGMHSLYISAYVCVCLRVCDPPFDTMMRVCASRAGDTCLCAGQRRCVDDYQLSPGGGNVGALDSGHGSTRCPLPQHQ